jgi:hypothetical protein
MSTGMEALTASGTGALAGSGRERVAAEVPADVARRLRVWAALRGQPAAHVVSAVICQAVPSAEELAKDMKGDSDHAADL